MRKMQQVSTSHFSNSVNEIQRKSRQKNQRETELDVTSVVPGVWTDDYSVGFFNFAYFIFLRHVKKCFLKSHCWRNQPLGWGGVKRKNKTKTPLLISAVSGVR